MFYLYKRKCGAISTAEIVKDPLNHLFALK